MGVHTVQGGCSYLGKVAVEGLGGAVWEWVYVGSRVGEIVGVDVGMGAGAWM